MVLNARQNLEIYGVLRKYMTEYVIQSWQQVWDDSYYLFEKIFESGFRPQIIVGIARGGWIPARLMADFFHTKQTANIKVEAYQTIGQSNEPVITQDILTNIKGKSVLVVDDVADSGATLQAVLEDLQSRHPKEVKTAMLYYKPRSSLKPDFYIHDTSAWVIFSWSIFEAVSDLQNLWEKEGLSLDQIIEKCKTIGIPGPIINSYFKYY